MLNIENYDLQNLDDCLYVIGYVLTNLNKHSQECINWAKSYKAMYEEINNPETGHGDFTQLDYYFNASDFERLLSK